MLKNRALALCLVALWVAFGLGVAHLFRLRFETGDIYPAYSSLRADPLGAKAFYESLNQLGTISVQRHYRPLSKLREQRDATLLYLAASEIDWKNPPEDLIQDFEAFAKAGRRVVITFSPEREARRRARADQERAENGENRSKRKVESEPNPKENKPSRSTNSKKRSEGDDPWEVPVRTVALKNRWGVDLVYRQMPQNSPAVLESVSGVKQDSGPLPASISWHTALTFDALDESWRVIYRRRDRPVLIERPWRRGTIVMAADSYFLSNEAMRAERHPELLAWLIGPSTKVVFDEAHFGIEETTGVVALARSYRLHGFFAGLLLLAGLFVWKNSQSFVPPYPDSPSDPDGSWVAGQDFTAGLVRLLSRNISARDILNVCVAEWMKSCAHGRGDWARKRALLQGVLEEENALSANLPTPAPLPGGELAASAPDQAPLPTNSLHSPAVGKSSGVDSWRRLTRFFGGRRFGPTRSPVNAYQRMSRILLERNGNT